jgi:hypothetical protein
LSLKGGIGYFEDVFAVPVDDFSLLLVIVIDLHGLGSLVFARSAVFVHDNLFGLFQTIFGPVLLVVMTTLRL